MKAILWPVIGAAGVGEIDGEHLATLQAHVGGPIQVVPIGSDGVVIICNEDGKLLKLPPNGLMLMNGDMLVGDVIICRVDGKGGFASLTTDDLVDIGRMVVRAGGSVQRGLAN